MKNLIKYVLLLFLVFGLSKPGFAYFDDYGKGSRNYVMPAAAPGLQDTHDPIIDDPLPPPPPPPDQPPITPDIENDEGMPAVPTPNEPEALKEVIPEDGDVYNIRKEAMEAFSKLIESYTKNQMEDLLNKIRVLDDDMHTEGVVLNPEPEP